ncbi:hypothetical protein CkaCkLH20_07538 [Colletotrichum karsti]|uniref:Uncharacterized protein n=1 Tax=Colletotrichum karsti TaxID=1095194 RepID=A0A9P6LG54_9PEZI|nr:uncharacterized protein CkaCkLH20_07538 [Colletotrichum karsti]KAF9874844.1 hypothetical protein CkaCkLH20_07538 [Colletotrichum karsti]
MTEVEASPWHGNQKPVSEKQREGDSNGKSTDSGIDTDSDQTNTDTDEIPSLETFIEYTAIEAYNHARDAASNSDNTTTADSRPIAELDPSSPWGTPNFQPKGPSWAAVVARIVYVLLSPCEWCRLFEHRWRLNEFFYMF